MRITIDRALAERFKPYAAITNQSVTDAIQEALDDWMNTIGEGRIELITGIPMDTEAERLNLPTLSLIAGEASEDMRLVN